MRIDTRILFLIGAFVLTAAACGGGNTDTCGNGTCESDNGETSETCAADCHCGDGVCKAERGEDLFTCPDDCHSECGNGLCELDEHDPNSDTYCSGDCSSQYAWCGNDVCDLEETPESCGHDCLGGTCGNGTCESGEDAGHCPADCFECSLIGAAENVGQGCSRDDMCGPGGACLDFGEGGQCYVVCSGECGTCASTEQCAPISAGGAPVEYLPGVDLAVCVPKPTGSQGAYDACGQADGACESGLDCTVFSADATRGYCAPSCASGEACPEREGVAGQCAVGPAGASPTSCALLCTPGANAVCPAGMVCQDLGGAGACLWE